jgi:hypothetical protein
MNQVLKLKSGSMCEYENPSGGVSYIITTLGTSMTYPTTTVTTTPIVTSYRNNLNRFYDSSILSTTSTRVNNAYRTDYNFFNIMKEFNRQQQQNEIMQEKRLTTISTRSYYTSFFDKDTKKTNTATTTTQTSTTTKYMGI